MADPTLQASVGEDKGLLPSLWSFRVSAALLLVGLVETALGVASGERLVRAGLIVLMATPALRVAGLLWGYVRRHDWGTVAAMLAVLAVVASTLFIATR